RTRHSYVRARAGRRAHRRDAREPARVRAAARGVCRVRASAGADRRAACGLYACGGRRGVPHGSRGRAGAVAVRAGRAGVCGGAGARGDVRRRVHRGARGRAALLARGGCAAAGAAAPAAGVCDRVGPRAAGRVRQHHVCRPAQRARLGPPAHRAHVLWAPSPACLCHRRAHARPPGHGHRELCWVRACL
ncbi:hypothetical protein GGF43_005096, partial [Coemansia sp. RSA 2618]